MYYIHMCIVYTYIHVCVCTLDACMHIHTCIHTHMYNIHTCIVYTNIHVCIHTCIVRIYIHVHACVVSWMPGHSGCMHAIHTHAYRHTYTHGCSDPEFVTKNKLTEYKQSHGVRDFEHAFGSYAAQHQTSTHTEQAVTTGQPLRQPWYCDVPASRESVMGTDAQGNKRFQRGILPTVDTIPTVGELDKIAGVHSYGTLRGCVLFFHGKPGRIGWYTRLQDYGEGCETMHTQYKGPTKSAARHRLSNLQGAPAWNVANCIQCCHVSMQLDGLLSPCVAGI